MIIRIAAINEYPEVLKHYEVCNYHGGVHQTDIVLIATDDQIIGAVRICTEHHVKVLRGMQIKKAFQKKGIGSLMLKYLEEHIDINGCYCLPYKHLKSFYGKIGFGEILPEMVPAFLNERLKKYLSEGYDEMIIMQINKVIIALAM